MTSNAIDKSKSGNKNGNQGWINSTQLKGLLTTSPTLLWTTDKNLQITFAAGAGFALTEEGKSLSEGMLLTDYLSPLKENHQIFNSHKNALAGVSDIYHLEYRGKIFNYYVDSIKNEAGKITGCLCIGLDVTKLNHLYTPKSLDNNTFQELAEKASIIPWVSDAKTWLFTYVGPQAQRILGYPTQDWYTKDFWANKIFDEDREKALEICITNCEIKDDYEFEYRMVRSDGEIVWFHDIVNVVRDETGPVMLRGYLIDITKRKKVEEELELYRSNLKELVNERTTELLRSNKDLEQFAYVATHDLKAPIINLQSLVDLLSEENFIAPEGKDIFDKVKQSIFQIQDTIKSLNEVISVKNSNDLIIERINPHSVLKKVLHNLEKVVLDSRAEILVHISSEIEVEYSCLYLESIFQNLIANAIKFRSPERNLKIKITGELSDNELVITVEDNGLGMNLDRIEDKMFGLFKRFHDHVEGKGIGLHIIKSIVESNGGEISVVSKVGKGSSFTIRIRV